MLTPTDTALAVLAGAAAPVFIALVLGWWVVRPLGLPVSRLMAQVGLGAVVAAPLAIVAGSIHIAFAVSATASAVLLAPVVEELVKLAVALAAAPRENRSSRIAAAVCVAGGFAAVENIVYLLNAADRAELFTTLLLRAGLGPVLHACFGVVVMLTLVRTRAGLPGALVAGAVLHAAWNFAAVVVAEPVLLAAAALALSALLVMVLVSLRRWQHAGVKEALVTHGFSDTELRVALSTASRGTTRGFDPVRRDRARRWARLATRRALVDAPGPAWEDLRRAALSWQ